MDYVSRQLRFEADSPESLKINIFSTTSFNKYPAKQHARRVAHKLGVSNGLVYLPGAETVFLEDSDQARPFRQRRYFYYLSGVDEPGCHLTYDIERDELILYVPTFSPRKVLWNGRGSNVTEALERYDVDNAFYSPDLTKDVDKWTQKNSEGKIYILHPTQAVRPGDDKRDRVDYTELQKAIDLARVIKDEYEIDMIQKANDISARAHAKVLSEIKSLSNETEVEAIFLKECMAEDAKHQAYNVIAASGENAAVLHYNKNDEPLEGRQLMCLDAGCEWNCYASDVTRTFPISGSSPSREAGDIYALVLKMQTQCISSLKPGIRFVDVHILAHQIAIEGLLELGILHNGSAREILMAGTSAAFFPHGLGHHVGLEVHDVSGVPVSANCWGHLEHRADVAANAVFHLFDPEEHFGAASWADTSLFQPKAPKLEAGMVVTVEPGIYFSRYALEELYFHNPAHSKYINKEVAKRYFPVGGVRIEDDILITKDGHKNLTTAPKFEAVFCPMAPEHELASAAARPGAGKESSGESVPCHHSKPEDSERENILVRRRTQISKMNSEKAQLTIEEVLKRLEKLYVDKKRKDERS